MKILVTGHNGYIGPVLTRMLIAQGHEVVGLDTNFYVGCEFNDDLPRIPEIIKDIRDVDHADLDGYEAVIHLAALSNDPLGNLNPDLTYEINHIGSLHLAKVAKEVGVSRFLFSSSCSTYGAAQEEMLTEEAKFNPVTPYGISKVYLERDLRQLADYSFSPVYLRNATVYGVSPRLRFGLVLHDLVASALTTGLVYLKSDGTPWRPIIHVKDVARAFIACLNAPRHHIHNEAFNVGLTSENYQIRQLAKIVRDVIPYSRIKYAPGAGPDKRSYRVDFSKIARTLPGFKPRWNARKGALELLGAFEVANLTAEDHQGPRYRRIDQIKKFLAEGQLDSSLRWSLPLPH
ncbi:MAG: SDR family oxidoreductase [Ardenticatenaceae bacterium]|nr:SDR family oxidoreductase [Ardenticatenaceae bacterium]